MKKNKATHLIGLTFVFSLLIPSITLACGTKLQDEPPSKPLSEAQLRDIRAEEQLQHTRLMGKASQSLEQVETITASEKLKLQEEDSIKLDQVLAPLMKILQKNQGGFARIESVATVLDSLIAIHQNYPVLGALERNVELEKLQAAAKSLRRNYAKEGTIRNLETQAELSQQISLLPVKETVRKFLIDYFNQSEEKTFEWCSLRLHCMTGSGLGVGTATGNLSGKRSACIFSESTVTPEAVLGAAVTVSKNSAVSRNNLFLNLSQPLYAGVGIFGAPTTYEELDKNCPTKPEGLKEAFFKNRFTEEQAKWKTQELGIGAGIGIGGQMICGALPIYSLQPCFQIVRERLGLTY